MRRYSSTDEVQNEILVELVNRITERDHRNSSSSPKGQGLVEFALILPVLLLLVYGTIEFGRLLFFYTAATTASREAARYGSAVGTNGGGVPYYRDCTGIMQAALQAGALAGLDSANIAISYDNGPGSSSFASCSSTVDVDLGDRIVVETTTNFTPMLPLVNLPAFPIQSSSARTIIKGVIIQGTPPNTPSPGPTATRTSTPTNTSTPTPTDTVTPTPTATTTSIPSTGTAPPPTETSPPTPTEVDICSYLGNSYILFGHHEFGMVLFNWHPSITVDISQVYVEWEEGTLKKVYLGSDRIWQGNDDPPNATISSFSGDNSLPPGAKSLRFELNSDVSYDTDILIQVTFSQGCTLSASIN